MSNFKTGNIKTLILLSLCTLPLFGETVQLPKHIETVTEYLLEQKYEDAERIITRTPLSTEDSLFLEVITQQAKIVDYESYNIYGKEFLHLCETARVEFQQVEEYKRPLLTTYYLGTMEGAAALTRGKRGDLMGALTGSNISKRNLDIIIKKDSSFAPGYFGIGMRRYYSASVLNKVGMGKKKLASSIKQMEISAKEETALGYSVLPSLFWIYMDHEMYEKAESISNRFLKRYPENTLMLRGLGKLYLKQKKYDSAMSIGHRLMKISQKRTPENWSDYYSGAVTVVSSLYSTGELIPAADEITRLLALEHDKKIMKLEWVKKHRKHLKQLKEEIILKLQ